jgi:EmrB/QacA subfamily drug resistance transporter
VGREQVSAGETARPGDAGLPRWRAFPALALGVAMATLDVSVVNIALPTLSRAFGVPLTTVEWVVLAYVLTITGLLLSLGRLSDQVGRRRVYGTGLLLFIGASALCGAAPSAAWLVAARAVQGLGAAMMSSNSAALLVSSFPAEERGRALGAFGAVVGIGLAVGTPLGGLVVGHWSWRWLFFINLPLGLLAFWLLRTRVPEDAPARPGARLDLGASAVWCGALVSLMLALSRGPADGWSRPHVLALFAGAAVLFAAFGAMESRSSEPLLPVRVVWGPLGLAFSLTLISHLLNVSVGFHLPLYLEGVMRFDAATTGRWIAIMPVAALVFSPLSGRYADRIGTRPLTALGMAMTTAGFWLLSRVEDAPHPALLLTGMALIGSGQGIFMVPNSSALLSLVPRELLGMASGLQATMRNLGVAAGAAAMAALAASSYAAHGGGTLSAHESDLNRPALSHATHDAYLVMTAVSAFGLILTLIQREGARRGAQGV